jgi:hypothetical protein
MQLVSIDLRDVASIFKINPDPALSTYFERRCDTAALAIASN